MSTIQLRELSFSYNSRPVLRAVSLKISPGERVAILGANGAGKTTLLKLIGGVLQPSGGSVTIAGSPLEALSRRDLARRVAAVPQVFSVPFAFSVREIVELGRTPHLRNMAGLSSTDRHAVEHALRLTGTREFANRIFNELSGGERQRVVIAMALAQEPEILLLDEPTQQLDLARQAEILDLIAGLNQSKGLTVVSAIHDLNLAARYFDRMVFLHDASIIMEGRPDQVLSPELLHKVYGSHIQVLRLSGQSLPVVLPLPASELRRGQNPESSAETKDE
jgi:iron complex transport system ATP-binding protein